MERPRTTRGNRTPEDQVAFDTFLNAFARLIGSTPTGVHIQISNATGEGIMGELKKASAGDTANVIRNMHFALEAGFIKPSNLSTSFCTGRAHRPERSAGSVGETCGCGRQRLWPSAADHHEEHEMVDNGNPNPAIDATTVELVLTAIDEALQDQVGWHYKQRLEDAHRKSGFREALKHALEVREVAIEQLHALARGSSPERCRQLSIQG